jgi:hypothetical protein
MAMSSRQEGHPNDVWAVALAALAALDAPEPNPEPITLCGGVQRWDDPAVQRSVRRDPANAITRRTDVVAACQRLQDLGYAAPGVRCGCGYGLGYLAILPLATGVQVGWSRHRLPPKRRAGGWADLAPIDPSYPEAGWAMDGWNRTLLEGSDVVKSSTRRQGLFGDAASRQTFDCPKCRASHPFLARTLLRKVLRAIADRTNEVSLGEAAGNPASATRYADRIADRGRARAWSSSRAPRR